LIPVSIPYRVAQGPASEATYSIYQVPSGERLTVKELEVVFPPGTGGYLEISVYHGIRKIAPEDGVFQLDEGREVARLRYTFLSGQWIKVLAKNTHTTETKTCSLLLEGELDQ